MELSTSGLIVVGVAAVGVLYLAWLWIDGVIRDGERREYWQRNGRGIK